MDLPRHMVGEAEEKGTITFTYVCEHYRIFLVEGYLWWVTSNHGERTKNR